MQKYIKLPKETIEQYKKNQIICENSKVNCLQCSLYMNEINSCIARDINGLFPNQMFYGQFTEHFEGKVVNWDELDIVTVEMNMFIKNKKIFD